MDGQIIADSSKLFELDDNLKNSTSKIDAVISENDELIRNTKQKINDVLDVWKRKQSEAYKKLVAAQEALARAEEAARNSEDGTVPAHYYQAVYRCQAEYDEITQICKSIEDIYDDFSMSALAYLSSIDGSRQEYLTTLKKGSYVLTKYAELVRQSSSITTGSTATNSSPTFGMNSGSDNTTTIPSIQTNQSNHNFSTSYELTTTNQEWTMNPDGSMVYNTPVETGSKLDSCQGKVDGFLGTCGIVSCVNVLRLAGYPATESEVVAYASNTSAGFGRGKLCTTRSFPEENGGTSANTRQQILNHFGITNEIREASVDNISNAVSEGRGVIISVYAGMLYYGRSNHRDLHAITVTSVKKDRHGNILGFYVCDSGTGGTDSSKFYSAYQIENALSGRPMNVTSIIR